MSRWIIGLPQEILRFSPAHFLLVFKKAWEINTVTSFPKRRNNVLADSACLQIILLLSVFLLNI
jgi:hypothetical protein